LSRQSVSDSPIGSRTRCPNGWISGACCCASGVPRSMTFPSKILMLMKLLEPIPYERDECCGCSERHRHPSSLPACCRTQEPNMTDTAGRNADLRLILSARRHEMQDEVQ